MIFTAAAEVFKCSSAKRVANLERDGFGLVSLLCSVDYGGIVLKM